MIKIKDVKLTKSGVSIEYEKYTPDPEDHQNMVKDTLTLSRPLEPHPDFVKCFDSLVPHFYNIAELGPAPQKPTTKKGLEAYKVTLVKFSEGETFKAVQLHGQKTLESGEVINILCPRRRYEAEQDNEYGYFEHLGKCAVKFLAEAQAYLDGKHKEPAQQALPLDGDGKK